jgi:site-specific recombinase XerD
VAKRAKIAKRVFPHLLRHSFACNLLNRGANVLTIKELLGHQDLRTTMIYVRSTPQRIQQEYNFYCPSYI